MKALKTRMFFQDLILWRFAGSVSWAVLISLFTEVFIGSTLSVLSAKDAFGLFGFRGILLIGLQLLVQFAHWRVMSAAEPPPLLQAPRLGSDSSASSRWVPQLVARLLIRGRKLSQVAAVAILYGSTAACAVAYAFLHPALRHCGFQWSLVYGLTVSLSYSTQHLAKCRDVLIHPIVPRHRYFLIKSRMFPIAASSARVAATSLALALFSGQATAPPWANPLQLASTFLSIWACVMGWMVGHAMIDIVFSERLRLSQRQDAAPFPVLIAQGIASDDAIVQDLTLLDLAATAEESGPAAAAARQALVFADEGGRSGWTPVGGFLLGEIRDATVLFAAAISPGAGDSSSSSSAPAAQWNSKSAMTSALASSGASRAQQARRDRELAAWTLRSRFYRLSACLRSLSALVAASRKEDRYGVVLLCDPNLADVLTTLASAVLALQQYTRILCVATARASGPLSGAVGTVVDALGCTPHPSLVKAELISFALEDLARGCLYRVVLTFGPSVKEVLKDAKQKPAFGSAADVTSLLLGMLELKE